MRWPKLLKKHSACLHKHQLFIFVDMKKIIAIVLVLAACIGCASQSSLKKQEDKITVEYKAMTRGRSVESTVTKVTISGNSKGRVENEVNKSTPSKEWDSMLAELEKIDLDKLMEIQPPSKKHQYDGAMAASVTVTVGDKSYRSATFDHGNPPAEIAALVNKLIKLGGIE